MGDISIPHYLYSIFYLLSFEPNFNTIGNYNRVCYDTTVEFWWITYERIAIGLHS